MNIISPEGKLIIALYHGTSSIFLDSIKEFGLGGKNPIYENEANFFFDLLYNIANEKLAEDQNWLAEKFAADLIKEQVVTDTGYNFRHGSVYLTPSKFKAVQYAKSNPYGEYITQCYHIYKMLINKGINLDHLRNKCINIFDIESKIILIKIDNIPIEKLRSENGQSAGDTFCEIQKYVDEEIKKLRDKKKLVAQANAGNQAAQVKVFLDDSYKKLPENEYEVFNSVILRTMFQSLNFELIGKLNCSDLNFYEIQDNGSLIAA